MHLDGIFTDSWIWLLCSRIACFFTILAGKALYIVNTFTVVNVDQLHNIVEDKDRTRPVITYGNHTSLIDPYVFASLLKLRYTLSYDFLPWAPSARDVCHRTKSGALYFRLCKSVPVDRGAGVFQPTMDFLVERLDNNNWVHLFPEGKINKDNEILPYKPGIARLISESKRPPIVIPIIFLGTNDVLPMKKPYKLRTGQRVTIVVGQPVQFSENINAAVENGTGDKTIWANITDELRQNIDELQERAQKLHCP